MRISTTQVYLQGMSAFADQQSKISTLQQQISTGTKLVKPSDDPVASSKVLELEQLLGEQEQFQRNINMAEQRLNLGEAMLTSVGDVIQRIRVLVIQANNSHNSQEALDAIAVEIEERYQQLLSIANTVDPKGEYLFAGFQNQNPPFTSTITGITQHVDFSGDDGQRHLQISRSRQINVDVSGKDIFMRVESTSGLNEFNNSPGTLTMSPAHVYDEAAYVPGEFLINFTGPGTYDVIDVNGVVVAAGSNLVTGATYTSGDEIEFNGIRTSIVGTPAGGEQFTVQQGQYRDMFEIVQTLSETLRDGGLSPLTRSETLGQTIEDLDNALGSVLEARTSLGGRMNALETQRDDGEAYMLATREVMSSLRDTDLAEAISLLTLNQTILEAAQGIFTRVTRSSLFDFLR